MADRQPAIEIDDNVRKAAADIILSMDVYCAKVAQENEPRCYEYERWFYLRWSSPRREGQLDARTQQFDQTRIGEELEDVIDGQRIVTLTVRAESPTWEVTAEQMLDKLQTMLESPGWHEEFARIGLVIQGAESDIINVPTLKGDRERSVAALPLRLAYRHRYIDTKHRYTWIETVVVQTVPERASVANDYPPDTWQDESESPYAGTAQAAGVDAEATPGDGTATGD